MATRDDCAADVASFPVTPQSPSNEQYFQLEKKAGQLIPLGETATVRSASGEAVLKFPLPRQAVSLQ